MPESREGFSPPERTDSSTTEKRKGRGRRDRRRKDRERQGSAGGSDTEKVTVVPRPGSEKHPGSTPDVSSTPPVTSGTTSSPDRSRSSGTAKPPDATKTDTRAPSVDTSDDDDDDGDAAVSTPLDSPASPTSSLDSAIPVSDKDTRGIFIPEGEGVGDKAKKWFQKGGRGLGFLGLGSLGVFAHLFRITARTAHQAYDSILYFAEKALYENSGVNKTIPWKWFVKPPEEPEYLKAKKRLEEMQKRSGGGGGDKRR